MSTFTTTTVERYQTLLIPSLAQHVSQMIQNRSRNPQASNTIYHMNIIPRISINDYLTRLAQYVSCSKECFVLSLIYIDQFMELNPGQTINSYTVHK